MQVLSFRDVHKEYMADACALQGVNFELHQGEFAALAGPSGSGKTTILNLAAGLDTPSRGSVSLLGQDLGALPPNQRLMLRRENIGFIFQSYNLFPILTAAENVEYPLALASVSVKERRARTQAALEEVGLGDLGNRKPSQLSGGQQQRVAIARALVTNPKIIMADEPTANLDSRTAEKLLWLFRELNKNTQITFLFSSHDPMVLRLARRTLKVVDGVIHEDSAHATKKKIIEVSERRIESDADALCSHCAGASDREGRSQLWPAGIV